MVLLVEMLIKVEMGDGPWNVEVIGGFDIWEKELLVFFLQDTSLGILLPNPLRMSSFDIPCPLWAVFCPDFGLGTLFLGLIYE